MQHFKALRTVSLILGFVLVTFGCATGKPVSSKSRQSVDVGLKAETVPEGISLTFDYIPPETTSIFIGINEGLENSQPASPHDSRFSYASIRDNALEQVKKTGRVIFPIVQSGQEYRVDIGIREKEFQQIEGVPEWINTQCVAGNGIYFDRGVELKLNNANSGATLSYDPEFSSDVIFSHEKYMFDVTVLTHVTETEITSVSFRGKDIPNVNGLTWIFEPKMTENFRQVNYLESGSYPAYATVFCNIIHDNIEWAVEIAKTPEFTYSL